MNLVLSFIVVSNNFLGTYISYRLLFVPELSSKKLLLKYVLQGKLYATVNTSASSSNAAWRIWEAGEHELVLTIFRMQFIGLFLICFYLHVYFETDPLSCTQTWELFCLNLPKLLLWNTFLKDIYFFTTKSYSLSSLQISLWAFYSWYIWKLNSTFYAFCELFPSLFLAFFSVRSNQ